MREAWKRQVWEATSWKKVRGPAGAVFREMKGSRNNAHKLAGAEAGARRMRSMNDICSQDVRKNIVQWRLEEGVWFESIKALLETKPNDSWTRRHVAQARSWAHQWSVTQKEAVPHRIGLTATICQAEGTGNTRL